jgi:hypothetical protein
MERQLQRGEEIAWCDQGYGWVYERPVNGFFDVVLAVVILPYVLLRLLPRIAAAVRHGAMARVLARAGAPLRSDPASAPMSPPGEPR